MVGKVSVTVKGLKEIDKALKQLGPELAEQAGDSALRAMGRVIVPEIQRFAPKRSGKYAENIGVQLDRKRGGDTSRHAHIGVKSPWSRLAHLLEFGTVKMAAKPHFRPALDARATDAIKEGGVALARALKTVTRRLATGKSVRRVR